MVYITLFPFLTHPFIYNLADKYAYTIHLISLPALPKTNKLSCWRNAKNQKVKTDKVIEYERSLPNDKLLKRSKKHNKKLPFVVYIFCLTNLSNIFMLSLKCGYDLKNCFLVISIYIAVFYCSKIILGSFSFSFYTKCYVSIFRMN